MPWSLVESVSPPGPRRAFYLPLASIPPGNSTVRQVESSQYQPSEERPGGDDVILKIQIRPPGGGSFSDEGALPDPAFRLHAMAPGELRFTPAGGGLDDRLTLRMPFFGPFQATAPPVQGVVSVNLRDLVPWWQRWIEAECIPEVVIYENVDRAGLDAHLKNLKPGQSFYGLALPPEVKTDAERQAFLTTFMAGTDPTYKLEAAAGAVIGAAAVDPADSSRRLLKLRGRYRGHVEPDHPFFMNPREFLNLLFGNESDEAKKHPLMDAIDYTGMQDLGHESKSLRVRPPLRTHARLLWEADIERGHAVDWSYAGRCGNRTYNRHRCEGHEFSAASHYPNLPKCNVFISDVAIRSGFRAVIQPATNILFHYLDVNQYISPVDAAAINTNETPLRGRIEGTARTWGRKIERWMRSFPNTAALRQGLNDAMHVEGRCFIVAGSRASGRAGHIMIVASVDANPVMVQQSQAGHGLVSITVTTREAQVVGAAKRDHQLFTLNGTGGQPDSTSNFVRLHLFELHPGQDPDTARGLRDCNVHV